MLSFLTWKMKSYDIVSSDGGDNDISDGGGNDSSSDDNNNDDNNNNSAAGNHEMNGNDKKTLSKYTIEKSVVRSHSLYTQRNSAISAI